ncbi:MAG TPA: hypothetical protein VFS40_12880 [Gemmatimonadales bacterium]|nr:hypothetical protein [Gemmatimonadales bacterium]
MGPFYLLLALAGGFLLLLQLVLGLLGLDHHGLDGHDAGQGGHGGHHGDGAAGPALQLVTLRGVTAAAAFFGLAGWGLERAGASPWLAFPLALLAGFLAMLLVAVLMRSLLRFEDDGTVRIEGAVGRPATVYVPIPAAGAGHGKVQLMVQNRTVEYEALTREGAALATGAPVTVVGVVGPGVVEVVATPTESELFDA